MVWEHNVTIIVMLTKLKEMGREKCVQYWPTDRSTRYGYFIVDPVGAYNMPQYLLSEFKVTDSRVKKTKIFFFATNRIDGYFDRMDNLELSAIFYIRNGRNKVYQKLVKVSLILLDKYIKPRKVLVKKDLSSYIVQLVN
jgi:protein tyrosine phosphatase